MAWPAMEEDPTTEPATAETTKRLLSSPAGGPAALSGGRAAGARSQETTCLREPHGLSAISQVCQCGWDKIDAGYLSFQGAARGLLRVYVSAGVGSAGRRRSKGHDGVTPGPSRPACRDAAGPGPHSSAGVHRTARGTEEALSPPARTAEGWTWLSGGPGSSQPEEGQCDRLGAALDTRPGPGRDARLLLSRAPVLHATPST